jgi:hypothetical protein
MVPVRLLHPDEIGEGLLPVGVPVIRAGAVEAGVDQDGEVFEGGHSVGAGDSWRDGFGVTKSKWGGHCREKLNLSHWLPIFGVWYRPSCNCFKN